MSTQPAASSSYLLLFRNAGPDAHAHLDARQREELTKQWNDWYDQLVKAGKVDHGRPLGLGGRVVSGKRGETVRDGPFAEGKEIVGGYFLLTVPTIDEA